MSSMSNWGFGGGGDERQWKGATKFTNKTWYTVIRVRRSVVMFQWFVQSSNTTKCINYFYCS